MVAEAGFWTTLVPTSKIYDEAQAAATAEVGKNMGAYNGIFGLLLLWLALEVPELGGAAGQGFRHLRSSSESSSPEPSGV